MRIRVCVTVELTPDDAEALTFYRFKKPRVAQATLREYVREVVEADGEGGLQEQVSHGRLVRGALSHKYDEEI